MLVEFYCRLSKWELYLHEWRYFRLNWINPTHRKTKFETFWQPQQKFRYLRKKNPEFFERKVQSQSHFHIIISYVFERISRWWVFIWPAGPIQNIFSLLVLPTIPIHFYTKHFDFNYPLKTLIDSIRVQNCSCRYNCFGPSNLIRSKELLDNLIWCDWHSLDCISFWSISSN